MPPRRAAQTPPADPDTPPAEYDEDRLCKGVCNILWHKHGKGVPTEGDPYLCERCQRTLRSELQELDTLGAMLAASIDGHRGSTASDAAIRAHRGANSRPSASPDADMLNELENELKQWIRMKRPVHGRFGLLARTTTEATAWLYQNADLYTSDPDNAGAFFEAIHRWHGLLTKKTKAGPALFSKPLPCPRCQGGKSLVQEAGSEIVYCTNCNRHMSVQEYEDLAAEAAEAAEAAKQTPAAKRKTAAAKAAQE
jgi:hypothetical protein